MNWHWQNIVGRMLGLEDVRTIDSIQPSLAASWAQRYPGLLVAGCVGLCLLAVGFYLRYQRGHHRGWRLALGIGRAVVLALLLLLLAEPVLQIRLTSSPKPLLWVLFDGTESMAISDELPDDERAKLAKAVALDKDTDKAKLRNISRIDLVRSWLTRANDPVIAGLASEFRVKAFLLDRADGVRALDFDEADPKASSAKLAEQLSAAGQVTALGRGFDDLGQRHSANHLAGVIVVSDFDQNSGPPASGRAQSLRAPIYTVGIGPENAIDVRVDLQAAPLMKLAERSVVLASVRQTGLEGQSVTVTLSARRLSGSTAETGEKFEIGAKPAEMNGPLTTVEFPFTPDKTGRFEFIAEVEPVSGEVITQNNRAVREVNIRDDFLRLMFVEDEPTWEWRFIKEVFHRDKLVGQRGFRTFLRSSDPKVRTTNELFLPTMTPARSEFFANDVLFIGDLPAQRLSGRFCEMVKEFVSTFGGGLVILTGPRNGPSQLAKTPLADLLPVIVDGDSRAVDRSQFAIKLTPEASEFEFMQLGDGPAENAKAWENLGKLPWYQPVSRPHPLATVLAEHPTDNCVDNKTPQPLIAVRRYGKGEVIYLATNETWRLRRKFGEKYYRQFWGQMIHRLGLSHALGSQKRFVVRTDRQQYQADERVLIAAEAYDANFEPLSEDKLPERKITGELIPPDAAGASLEPVRVSLTQVRPGAFEANVPVFQPGEYRVRIKDPITSEVTELPFQVTSISVERRSAVRNRASQDEIARLTGGKSYDLTTADSLLSDIKLKPLSETSLRIFPLWSTWLSFALLTALLLMEWLVRKMINLP